MRFAAFHDNSANTLRLLQTATLAVVLSLLAADRAEASCGDWLGHVDPGAETAEISDRDQPSSSTPCDGPSCRDSREHLPAAPSAPSRQFDQPDRWCRLIEDLGERPSLVGLLPCEASPIRSEGHRPSIDRPPRV